jgi:hypothetical protein
LGGGVFCASDASRSRRSSFFFFEDENSRESPREGTGETRSGVRAVFGGDARSTSSSERDDFGESPSPSPSPF